METTCVYFHVNKVKQEIFYVGIGFSERPYQKKSRSKWWKALTAAYDYEAIVIHENLTWEKACELEKFYIAQIGRRDQNNGTLINLTDGGDGVFGRILSDKQRQRISELNAEREWTEEARAKISAIHKGKIVSEEQREKLRQKMLGKKLGKLTDSHKQKIRDSAVGRKHTEEAKRNMSESKKGKMLSLEHKKALSEAAIRRFQKRSSENDSI